MRAIIPAWFHSLAFAIFLCFAASAPRLSITESSQSTTDFQANHKTIRAWLDLPESRMDLASIKVTVDHMVDPATDKTSVLRQIDELASAIRSTFPAQSGNLAKFKLLRDYLYRPEPSSGRTPFRYDLDHDMNPRAKLLDVYLSTQKGNCISMPLLFVLLGQKLDIPVALASAPAHLYLKFRGDDGVWHGVEATSGGGWADDDWQRKQFPRITETAITNGLYLQPLSQRQSVTAIAESLLEHYESQSTLEADEARVKLALMLIEHDPKNAVAMVHTYLGYRSIRQRLFVEKYLRPMDIPAHMWPQFTQIENDSLYWGERAKAMGYMPSTPAMDAEYRERIRRARAAKANQ